MGRAHPEDEHSAGTVLIWDTDPYRDLREHNENEAFAMPEALEEGKVEVWLKGETLQGGCVLIRTGKGDDSRWLLIKMDDEEPDARRNPTSTETKYVLSGRTLEEIAEE